MVPLEFSFGRAVDRALKGVGIEDIKVLSHIDSSSAFFSGCHTEITAVIMEVLGAVSLVEHQREDSLF